MTASAKKRKRSKLVWWRRAGNSPGILKLSNREVWTGKFIAEQLRQLGFRDIRTEVARHGCGCDAEGRQTRAL